MERKPSLRPSLPLALCLLAAPAFSDLLTGRVVGEDGAGIAGADIDVFDAVSGANVPLVGDFTDAAGNFSVSVPTGFYRVVVRGPGGSNLVPAERPDQIVLGSLDLGSVTLRPGFLVGGRVIGSGGLPVADVDLLALHRPSGELSTVVDGRTDALGLFNVRLPADVELRFDPRNAAGPPLAPRAEVLALTADTQLGDIALVPGVVVQGTAVDPAGTPVASAPLTFRDSQTGSEALLLPAETDFTGSFSVVVAPGTWDMRLCPSASSGLVALEILGVTLSNDLNLGTRVFENGLPLFGLVHDANGLAVAGADVEVTDSATGAPVALCQEQTNAGGAFSVVVRPGTYDVRFSASAGLDIHEDVAVAGPTLVDGTLTPCPPASATVRNGSGVNPIALSSAAPQLGKTWSADLDCSGHAPSVGAIFLTRSPHAGLSTSSGELLVAGTTLFLQVQPHSGDVITFSTPVPANLGLCGAPGYLQGMILGAPGSQLTNALDLVVGR